MLQMILSLFVNTVLYAWHKQQYFCQNHRNVYIMTSIDDCIECTKCIQH